VASVPVALLSHEAQQGCLTSEDVKAGDLEDLYLTVTLMCRSDGGCLDLWSADHLLTTEYLI
jgi:hypothetical protein